MGESEKRIGRAIKENGGWPKIYFYQLNLIEIWIL
jgi:hypothetical protein